MYPSAGQPTVEDLTDAIGALAEDDYSTWPTAALSEHVGALARLAERAQATLLAAVGTWDHRQGWAQDGALSPAAWLTHHHEVPRAGARRIVRTARLVAGNDRMAKLVAAGDLTVDKADILSAVAIPARRTIWERDADVLLDAACSLTPHEVQVVAARWAEWADDELDRGQPHDAYEQRRVLASTNLTTGELHAYGPAADIEAIVALLDRRQPPDPTGAATPARSLAQRRYDALTGAVPTALADGDGRIDADHTLNVVVDFDTFDRLLSRTGPAGAGAGTGADSQTGFDTGTSFDPGSSFDPYGSCRTLDGSAIPASTLQRLACDSWVSRLVFGPDGEILDQGRRTRLFTSSQRRAIRARDQHCVFPGCDHPTDWCDIHHLVPWEQGGATDIANGACLCRRHHTLVHEGGWLLTRGPDGTWHASAPP